MSEANYLSQRLNALQAQYDELLRAVADGMILVPAPAIQVDVSSLDSGMLREVLIAAGWTPPGQGKSS